MTDEELERLLRQSNPATIPVDDPLTLRHRSMLDRIVEGPYPEPQRPRKLAWLVTVPVAAVLAVVVAMVLHPFATPSAAAWGPVPLTYVSSSTSLEETIGMAVDRARASTVSGPAERGAVSTSWNLQVNDAGTPQQVTEIVPSVADLTWAKDLSGRLVTSVGKPYRADGSGAPPMDGDTPHAGDIIDDRVYGPGDYPALVSDAQTLDRRGIESLLSAVMTDPALPGDALPIVQGLLSEWTLTGEQHADLVEALMAYGNLRLLGTTTDRLGREVIGVGAPSSSDREATFFLSAGSGRVIGVEHTVVGTDDILGVPQGTVISYTMWKDSQ